MEKLPINQTREDKEEYNETGGYMRDKAGQLQTKIVLAKCRETYLTSPTTTHHCRPSTDPPRFDRAAG